MKNIKGVTYPGYNFLGPQPLLKDVHAIRRYAKSNPPINYLDEQALRHDMEYARIIQATGGQSDAYYKCNQADLDFIKRVEVGILQNRIRGADIIPANIAMGWFTAKCNLAAMSDVPAMTDEQAEYFWGYGHLEEKEDMDIDRETLSGYKRKGIQAFKDYYQDSFMRNAKFQALPRSARIGGKHPTNTKITPSRTVRRRDIFPLGAINFVV